MNSVRKFDGVLPAIWKEKDRILLLLESIDKNLRDLNILWIIVPHKEVSRFDNLLINRNRIQILSEHSVVPELTETRIAGWHIQQFIKIAMFDKVTTPYYLTLDTDVVCPTPKGFDDFFKSGKPAALMGPVGGFREWYQWAARVLKMKEANFSFSVTPTFLSRDGVRQLVQHLDNLRPESKPKMISRTGLKLLWRKVTFRTNRRWMMRLISVLPWTEYATYFTFLVGSGLLEKYHYISSEEIYDYKNSVWTKDQIKYFDPVKVEQANKGFLVFQSNTEIQIEEVREKVSKFLV